MIAPRIVIAGTNSGSGKTTFVAGLLAAFRSRGMTAQPFKTGPDYIDPGFHSLASGRQCRNLDTMLLSKNRTLELFARNSAGADISIIEGVMGLFDGAGARDERGSTAHLAKTLEAPVILVINGRSMARSAAAIAVGFDRFDKRLGISAVLLNNLGSANHYRIIKEAIEGDAGIPVLGYLPRTAEIALPERHLGLVPAAERKEGAEMIDRLRRLVEEHIDLDAIVELSRQTPPLPACEPFLFASPPRGRMARIAVAADEAFHFYYQDNLDILEHLGAELHPFSPLRDARLPPATSGVYIGGGFPEEFAAQLAANESLKAELRAGAERGIPILAECGGLMYLVERLEDKAGTTHRMAGVFPGVTRMGKRLQALGYCGGKLERGTLAGRKGATLRGHLFHWSFYDSEGHDDLFSLRLEKNGNVFRDGLAKRNAFASYLHLHFGTNLAPANRFLERAWSEG